MRRAKNVERGYRLVCIDLIGGSHRSRSIILGTYRLTFDVAAYFVPKGVPLPQPNFLNQVSIDFGIAEPTAHYHVPLLVSPWSYSTYRGP